MDWAKMKAEELFMSISNKELVEVAQPLVERIAAELRKAKASGMREAADMLQDLPARYQPERAPLYIRASAIENGAE